MRKNITAVRLVAAILAVFLLFFPLTFSADSAITPDTVRNTDSIEIPRSITLTDEERDALVLRALLKQRYLPFQNYGYIFAQNAPCTTTTPWFCLQFYTPGAIITANACAGAAFRLLEAANLIDLSHSQVMYYGAVNSIKPNSPQIENFVFPDDLRPGDIIYWSNLGAMGNKHNAVYLQSNNDIISVFNGNDAGKINWNRTFSLSSLLSVNNPAYGVSWVIRFNLNVENLVTPNPDNPVNPFLDVDEDDFYYDAVVWAYNHEPQIASGTGTTTFSPDNTVKRCEAVTFLWAAADKPEPITTVNPFSDISSDKYYYKAVLWAAENGITSGTGDGTTFSPNATVKRRDMLMFLWRFAGSVQPTITGSPFTDVSSDAYYYKPVLWAYENGVLVGNEGGDNPNLLHPSVGCSRAYVVSYIYNLISNE